MRFHFELGDTVVIDASGEKGEVIGRAEYIASSNQYYVRYKNAQGVAVAGESVAAKVFAMELLRC